MFFPSTMQGTLFMGICWDVFGACDSKKKIHNSVVCGPKIIKCLKCHETCWVDAYLTFGSLEIDI